MVSNFKDYKVNDSSLLKLDNIYVLPIVVDFVIFWVKHCKVLDQCVDQQSHFLTHKKERFMIQSRMINNHIKRLDLMCLGIIDLNELKFRLLTGLLLNN